MKLFVLPVTLFATFLDTSSEHDDGARVGLPTHPPKVVPGGVERSLCDDKLPGRVVARHKVGVDKVRPLFVVCGLQLDPGVVVRQDVGEPVFGPVDRHVRRRARLLAAHVLQLLVLFGEPEVRVGRHDAVVLGKVLQLHRLGRLHHRVGQRDVVTSMSHVSSSCATNARHPPHLDTTRGVGIGRIVTLVANPKHKKTLALITPSATKYLLSFVCVYSLINISPQRCVKCEGENA